MIVSVYLAVNGVFLLHLFTQYLIKRDVEMLKWMEPYFWIWPGLVIINPDYQMSGFVGHVYLGGLVCRLLLPTLFAKTYQLIEKLFQPLATKVEDHLLEKWE